MLTAAIVDEKRVSIDTYGHLTIDRSIIDGRYYSDKAPGMALFAIPTYAVVNALHAARHDNRINLITPIESEFRTGRIKEVDQSFARVVLLRAMVWLTGGVLFASAGVAMFRFAIRLGYQQHHAISATLITFVATPFLGWSAQFFGHVAAGALLFLAFVHLALLAEQMTRTRQLCFAGLGGLLLGLAITTEYVAAVPCLLIAVFAFWKIRQMGGKMIFLLAAVGLLGSCLGLIPALVYHDAAFGGPFTVGYSHLDGWEEMQTGFMGLTVPSPRIIYHILLGPIRGILWLSPVLMIVPFAFWLGIRSGRNRAELLLCASVLTYYILMNASFYFWHGGASLGPRHVMASIPFAGLAILWAWGNATDRWRKLILILAVPSAFISVVSPLVTMVPSSIYKLPVADPIMTGLFTEQRLIT